MNRNGGAAARKPLSTKITVTAKPEAGRICLAGFDDDTRNRILCRLKRHKRVDQSKVPAFVDKALRIINLHLELFEPDAKTTDVARHDLDQLSKHAEAFAQSVEKISGELQDQLILAQEEIERSPRQEKFRSLPNFARTVEAARWARVTARAAELMMQKYIPPTQTNAREREQRHTIRELAECYRNVFGKDASSARDGRFAALMAEILAEVHKSRPGAAEALPLPGESRLKTILAKAAH